MVEAHVRARTGASLRTHQRRTVRNYLQLRDIDPELPFIPVLQGDSAADYHWCADLYERHGVALSRLPLVGVRSVCRRQHSAHVERIMRSLHTRGLRLHGFGVKVTGLARYADTLASSDSAAWSYSGRYQPGCTPSHRTESNCLRYALDWHTRLRDSLTIARNSTRAGGGRTRPSSPMRPGVPCRAGQRGRTRIAREEAHRAR